MNLTLPYAFVEENCRLSTIYYGKFCDKAVFGDVTKLALDCSLIPVEGRECEKVGEYTSIHY